MEYGYLTEIMFATDAENAPFQKRSLFCPHFVQDVLVCTALQDHQHDADESLAKMC